MDKISIKKYEFWIFLAVVLAMACFGLSKANAVSLSQTDYSAQSDPRSFPTYTTLRQQTIDFAGFVSPASSTITFKVRTTASTTVTISCPDGFHAVDGNYGDSDTYVGTLHTIVIGSNWATNNPTCLTLFTTASTTSALELSEMTDGVRAYGSLSDKYPASRAAWYNNFSSFSGYDTTINDMYFEITQTSPPAETRQVNALYPVNHTVISPAFFGFLIDATLLNTDASSTYITQVFWYPHGSSNITSSSQVAMPQEVQNYQVNFSANGYTFINAQQYDWYAVMYKNGSIVASSTISTFITSNAVPVMLPSISTSGLPIFQEIVSCDAGSTPASSTLDIIACNVKNFFFTIWNATADFTIRVLNSIKDAVLAIFPINLFNHVNADIKIASQSAPTSTPVMDLQFGNTNLVFISSDTIDKAGQDISFNFREIFDYVMYGATGVLMIIIGGATFVHFKKRHGKQK